MKERGMSKIINQIGKKYLCIGPKSEFWGDLWKQQIAFTVTLLNSALVTLVMAPRSQGQDPQLCSFAVTVKACTSSRGWALRLCGGQLPSATFPAGVEPGTQ